MADVLQWLTDTMSNIITWPTNGFRNSDEEVVGVTINRRKRLEKDVSVGSDPKRTTLSIENNRYNCLFPLTSINSV